MAGDSIYPDAAMFYREPPASSVDAPLSALASVTHTAPDALVRRVMPVTKNGSRKPRNGGTPIQAAMSVHDPLLHATNR